MKKSFVASCLFVLPTVMLGLANRAGAAVMALWEFGPGAIYTEEPLVDRTGGAAISLTGGDKDLNGKSGVAYVDADGQSHPAGIAAAWDNVTSETEILITVNTSGWRDMILRFDYLSESTLETLGPATFDLHYRTGPEADWTRVYNNEPLIRDSLWHALVINLVLHNHLENEPFVQFRIDDLQRGDESGGTFKIDNVELTGAPLDSSILLLAPNGGENLISGQTLDIRWQTSGVLSLVKLEYTLDSGAEWTEIATVDNTGVLVWEIPDANSPDCLIRASNSIDPEVFDVSDGAFRIYRCLLNFDLNGDCYIDMQDLALLASEWLLCGDVLDPRCF